MGGSDGTVDVAAARGDGAASRGPAVPAWVPAVKDPPLLLPVDPSAAATAPVVNRLPGAADLPVITQPAAGMPVLGTTSGSGAANAPDETATAPALDEPELDAILDTILSSRLQTSRAMSGELETLIAISDEAPPVLSILGVASAPE